MAAQTFYFPVPGTVVGEGYTLQFYIAGTTTPTPVYHTSVPATPWAQPITFNADGTPDGPIFLASSPALKVVLKDADGVDAPGYPFDNFSPLEVA